MTTKSIPIKEQFKDTEEFTRILQTASDMPKNKWEEDFLESIREKWDEYKENMYLSERQYNCLVKIAYPNERK